MLKAGFSKVFKRNSIIEINDDYLVKHDINRKKFKLRCNSEIYNLNIFKSLDIYLDLKHRNTCVIVEGEEINIKLLTLPKVKGEALYDLIKNELFYYFKDLENVTFNYSILEEYKNKLDILVFCLDKRKINFIEKCIGSDIIIKGVYLLQFCLLNYFRTKIKEKNYVFVFIFRENIYFLYCIDNKVLHNNVYKAASNSMQELLNNFIERSKILYDKDIYKVYFANCSNKEFDNDLLNKIAYENLGEIDVNNLICSLAVKGS